MSLKAVLWVGSAIVAFLLLGFGAWMLSLPAATATVVQLPVPAEEASAALSALRPPKREHPLIAIIGINNATETTDYIVPYGILRQADIAEVVALATTPGPVRLFPALRVEPDATVAEFDDRHPQGADYVIVPAMSRDDDPVALGWIRTQTTKGATVIGICAGAKIVGAAGVLDGKQATTHWYFLSQLRNDNPSVIYVSDRRFVVDRGVATTTGITASMPMMLTLIEAIAGRNRAEAVAKDVGLAEWDVRHDSSAFKLTRVFAMTVLGNVLSFWSQERLGIELTSGIDEVSLALITDAWSRTYRSQAQTIAAAPEAMTTRNGMRILPDVVAANWSGERLPLAIEGRSSTKALDETLRAIEARYGRRTADLVAMQLEYPRQRTPQ